MGLNNTPLKVGQTVVNRNGATLKVIGTDEVFADRPTVTLEYSYGGDIALWNFEPYCGQQYCNEQESEEDIVTILNKEKVKLNWD